MSCGIGLEGEKSVESARGASAFRGLRVANRLDRRQVPSDMGIVRRNWIAAGVAILVIAASVTFLVTAALLHDSRPLIERGTVTGPLASEIEKIVRENREGEVPILLSDGFCLFMISPYYDVNASDRSRLNISEYRAKTLHDWAIGREATCFLLIDREGREVEFAYLNVTTDVSMDVEKTCGRGRLVVGPPARAGWRSLDFLRPNDSSLGVR